MLGGSTVNRVANSSAESPYRSSPVPPTIAQQQQHYYPSTSSLSSRDASTPASTITPSASSSVAAHTPPYQSTSASSQDVPAYVQSAPHQPFNNYHPAQQFTDPSFAMTSTSSREVSSADPTMTAGSSRYYPAEFPQSSTSHPAQIHMSGSSNIPPPSSPQLHPTHPTHPSTRSLGGSETTSPSRIKVRSLSHIQSFASEEFLEQAQQSRRPDRGPAELGRQYEISSMPVTDIIEMVAGLLSKITATNDMQHEHIHRHIPPPDGTANLSAQASSVLAFHGKNVPSITILNYLARIHKYCPTTYEVFLSLLVYFDRMTETVNNRPIHRSRNRMNSASTRSLEVRSRSTSAATHRTSLSGYPAVVTPPSSSGITAQDLKSSEASIPSSLQLDEDDAEEFANFFVVDSFNIHRLVIAGVTCASKFFSDVFYTNSRYAKVGGLPLVELNHLELQFLLLNDFRLAVPVEELEAYGTMLVEFYAREVIAQQQQQQVVLTNIPSSIDYVSREPHRHHHHHHHRRDGSEYGQTPTPPGT